MDEIKKALALRLALDRMVLWGLYGASDGSLPGREVQMLLRSFLAWHWKRNRKEMASTTIAIARKGFAGLYFLSIDGLAEAGELRGFLRCIYRQGNHCFAFPAGLRMEVIGKRRNE